MQLNPLRNCQPTGHVHITHYPTCIQMENCALLPDYCPPRPHSRLDQRVNWFSTGFSRNHLKQLWNQQPGDNCCQPAVNWLSTGLNQSSTGTCWIVIKVVNWFSTGFSSNQLKPVVVPATWGQLLSTGCQLVSAVIS